MQPEQKDPERSCIYKTQYKDYVSARMSALRFSVKMSDRYEPYYCNYCHSWHIGHPIGMHRRKPMAKLVQLATETPLSNVKEERQRKHEAILAYQKEHRKNPPKGSFD